MADLKILTEEEFWQEVLDAAGEMSQARFGVDDLMRMRNLVRRKLWLSTNIDDECNVDELTEAIMQYNADDDAREIPPEERTPIRLYIHCCGGDAFEGMRLVEVIRCSRTPVWTIVQTTAMSMAFYVTIAGHRRFAMENAAFLIHDGDICIGNSSSKTDDFMKFNKLFQERLNKLVAERTRITEDTLKAKEREDWYMFADQALLLGVVDEIITPDRGMKDII